MAGKVIRSAGGKRTTILWEVKRTSTDGSRTRFYALRSDGVLLSRDSHKYESYDHRMVTDSGHWTINRCGLKDQATQDTTLAWFTQHGYLVTEKA